MMCYRNHGAGQGVNSVLRGEEEVGVKKEWSASMIAPVTSRLSAMLKLGQV